MRHLLTVGLIVGFAAWLPLSFCSCSDDSDTGGGAAAAGGSAAAGNSTGLGGELSLGGNGSGGDGQGGDDSCAGETVSADPVPLDMYIMLDRSGSMAQDTGVAGVTKWEAVTAGLDAFFSDAESDGLGVALQFFPLNKPGVPDTCTAHDQCAPDGGICLLSVCEGYLQLGQLVGCQIEADCSGNGPCSELGECENDATQPCLDPGNSSCSGSLGACVSKTASVCTDALSCDVAQYGAPAVAMDTLTAAATALNDAIGEQTLSGNTPTSAALQGAVDYALSYKQDNPQHTVVAVLATDGVPTECDPTDTPTIAQIAADALAGDPEVFTFVIGVVNPADTGAQQTLDTIASSGGTNTAFIVDPNGNVTQAFLAALNAIRGSQLACEYLVPEPEPPEVIDYGKVNVEHTPQGSTSANTIPYVGDESSCDSTDGGWYYDVDPQDGDPTTIIMCPATCDVLQTGGDLEIIVGCETIVPR